MITLKTGVKTPPKTQTTDHMSQPAEFPPLPETTGNVGEVSGGTVAPFCDAMR